MRREARGTNVALLALLAGTLASASARASEAATADAGSASAVPDPDAPTVTARVDKAQAHVGDAINLTVTAIGRRGVAVNLPGTIALDPFSVLERKEAEQDLGDGKQRREFTLVVAAYEPGEVEIPPVEVTYLGKRGEVRSARTSPIAVKIASLIANEPEPALKEIAPPVAVRQQDLLLAYVAGGLLAAAIGALLTWVIVRRLRGRALQRPGPPPRPAHEIALEKLDRLGAYGFLENADNRPFYFAVSEVIREYLGARFGFDSLELTTDELVAELRRRASRELILGEVQGWLSTCDLVKFAKISPSASEARGTLETAILIVSSTRPRVEVAPAAGTGPAGTPAPGRDASAGAGRG